MAAFHPFLPLAGPVLEHLVYTERVGGGRQSASSCPVKADQNCGARCGADLRSIGITASSSVSYDEVWETSRSANVPLLLL
jgi:hypothetical protein